MGRRSLLALGVGLALVVGYVLGHVLQCSDTASSEKPQSRVVEPPPAPDTAPPQGAESREIDSIPGKAIVEFYGWSRVIDRRKRYLRDDKGLRPLDLSDLSWYIAEKHERGVVSRDQAILDFIALHNVRETLVLSSPRDIPGFKTEQLDPDLRVLSMERLDVPDPKNPLMTLTIVYTWTQLGGELKRYRFRTLQGKAPYCYSCATLQVEVGAAHYLR